MYSQGVACSYLIQINASVEKGITWGVSVQYIVYTKERYYVFSSV